MEISKHLPFTTNHFYFVAGTLYVNEHAVQYSCSLDYHYSIEHSYILIAHENELNEKDVKIIKETVIKYLNNYLKI